MTKIIAIVFAVLGLPLFAVMGFTALLSYSLNEDLVLLGIFFEFYKLADTPMLEALPLFAFAGYLLAHSNAPERLVRVSDALLGWMPGGLAIVAIIACSLLTALTGASGVTIVALGGLLLPAMMQQQYKENFTLGTLTAGGSLGLLFAPSLPIILYGVIAQISVDNLFRAGIIPGLLVISILSVYSVYRGKRDEVPRTAFAWAELRTAVWEAKWELPLPVIVLGGIYGGYMAVSEAAVVTVAYIFVVEVLIYRDIPWRKLGSVTRESMVLVGGILIILGMTLALNNYMITVEAPQKLLNWIRTYISSPLTFLIALNLFLLLVGCMIDIYAAIVLVVPLLLPLADQFGIHPVHLGIIFLTNLGIGYATPPVGMNLFIASIRFEKPVLRLYIACLPFIGLLLLALILITYFPQLSLWLVPQAPVTP